MPELSRRVQTFTDSVIRRMTRINNMTPGSINLSQGFPDFDPPKEILDALKEAAEHGPHQYSITFGAKNFRDALAEMYTKKFAREIDPEKEIVVTCGGTEAMMAAMMTVCNPGDKVAVFSPFYENYGADAILSGADPIYIPLVPPDFYYDRAVLEQAFRDGAKALILCNPSNPCGKVFTMGEMEEIAELAKRYDAFVITDEVYEYIIYDGNRHISMAALPGMYERTITCSSLSKTYSMTGWRLGYAACNEEIVKTVNKLHQHVVTCATSFVQKAGVVALKEEKNEVTDMVKEYQRRRDYAVKAINEIDGLSCRCPKGAFYIFINIEKLGMTGQEFAPLLLENAKVALVPGDIFGTEGDHYVRMSFANSYENVVEGCKRLKEFVEKLRRNK